MKTLNKLAPAHIIMAYTILSHEGEDWVSYFPAGVTEDMEGVYDDLIKWKCVDTNHKVLLSDKLKEELRERGDQLLGMFARMKSAAKPRRKKRDTSATTKRRVEAILHWMEDNGRTSITGDEMVDILPELADTPSWTHHPAVWYKGGVAGKVLAASYWRRAKCSWKRGTGMPIILNVIRMEEEVAA